LRDELFDRIDKRIRKLDSASLLLVA